ncbi:tetratricopeptide repeat protein [Helicobacter sp. MIT 01-3238]|uniref:tetratricopeptide repeat protein n=1 Tax=Helicobacter sp. MIT 01-3238 TaxID=398627 RepID=UPI0021632D89|nr:tetratricopeptide repeat protein [Helicobacter sp. MIT 01-3238]
MRKLVLACGILVGVVSVGMGAMSEEELRRAEHNCFEYEDKSACYALINNGLKSVEQCYIENGKGNCVVVGVVYYLAGRYREAIPYFEKAIALGDNRGYILLGKTYYFSQDYYNAKKYYEIVCNKLQARGSCYNLGNMYYNGEGVRQDYHKAVELYKKACDMKYADACNNLGVLYGNGQGVRQNSSTAKQY